MILCNTYKFVFIRTKKVAGTSVAHFLAHFLEGGDVISDNEIKDKTPFYKHMTASEFIEEFPAYWGGYFTFSIIRHPMERLVSEYFYSNRFGDYESFSEFIRSDHVKGTFNCDVLDTGDKLGFCYLARYENLVNDLQGILDLLKIPYKEINLPHENSGYRKDRRPWCEYITTEDKDYILREFKKEIEFHKRFGYEI